MTPSGVISRASARPVAPPVYAGGVIRSASKPPPAKTGGATVYCNSYENDWSIEFQGDQGTMILNAAGYRIWKEPAPQNPNPVQQKAAPIPLEAHVQNFLDCVKSRQEPNAPVEVGASAVSAPHLANVAFHAGRQARLSGDGFSAG